MTSLILLLAHPAEPHVADLRARFSRALGLPFGSTRDDPNTVLQLPDKPNLFPIRVGDLTFGLINSPDPYFTASPPNLDQYDARVRHALLRHRAWLSIDMSDATAAAHKSRAYPVLGRLLASLIDDDGNTLAVASTETHQIIWPHDALRDRLRSDDPLSALSNPASDFIEVRPDHPDLLAATAEARRRWPEFLAAYAARRPGQGFSVKGPITRDGVTEFMWLSPTALTPTHVRGRLASQPHAIPSLKPHDPVEFPASELNDWLYESPDTGTQQGGFTIAVLRRLSQPHLASNDPQPTRWPPATRPPQPAAPPIATTPSSRPRLRPAVTTAIVLALLILLTLLFLSLRSR